MSLQRRTSSVPPCRCRDVLATIVYGYGNAWSSTGAVADSDPQLLTVHGRENSVVVGTQRDSNV